MQQQIGLVDPNMRHLVGDTAEHAGMQYHQDGGVLFEHGGPQETHVMLSEEEEEEDEDSDHEIRSPDVNVPGAEFIGEHLTGEPRARPPVLSPGQQASKEAPRTQIFSGSDDEWNDQRIQEF